MSLISTSNTSYIAHQLSSIKNDTLTSVKKDKPKSTKPISKQITYNSYLKHLLETDKSKALSYFKKSDITAMTKNEGVLQSKTGSKSRLNKEYNFLKAVAMKDIKIRNQLKADANKK